MSVTSRTQRMSAAERREQLLDVTKELVGEHGFHDVTMEAVARRAGITRPIVYGHFHDLRGLLQALLEREKDRALAQLAEVVRPVLGTGPGMASPDPPLTARMLSALADEAARLLLTEPDEYPLERLL